jgi:glucosamine kinase
MTEPLFLGIDGGGTACKARLCDADGKILAEAVTGPANTLLGAERAMVEINLATNKVLDLAGLHQDKVIEVHVGAGLAGMSLQREQKRLTDVPIRFASFAVHTDAYVACLGANGGEDGGVLIAGTGSCAALINKGEFLSFGGWGFLVSDHGSGAHLGRAALRYALLAHDQVKPQSPMSDWIMDDFKQSPEEMVIWAETAKPGDYGKFVPRIFDFAREGDAAAQALVQATADDLADFVRALVKRGAGSICLIGGIAEPVKAWLTDDIQKYLGVRQGDSLDGALMMARRGFARRTPAENPS